jgi:transposase-like protein
MAVAEWRPALTHRMSSTRAICPQCKAEVVFEAHGHTKRCPACGFAYQVSPAFAPPAGEPSALMEFAVMLGKVLLIMAALGLVGIGIFFAGCALLTKGL